MDELTNTVETTLTVAGTKCSFVSLRLRQGFNCHHVLWAEINAEALGQKWMSDPKKIVELIGESISVNMKNKTTGKENYFEGIITNTSIIGRNGVNNNIIIIGKSPTIRLDGKKAMDSFTDKTLENVVKEAVSNSGNGAEIKVEPTYNESIDFICQYDETDFQFLNRLSWIYGEWFYYDGTAIKFGKGTPDTDEINLVYDVDIVDFNLSAQLVPAKFNRYSYLVHQDQEVSSVAPEDVPGLRGYLKSALQKSDGIYKSEGDLPVEAPILSKKELDDLVQIERSRAVGNMMQFTGSSNNCEVGIGKTVNIKLPDTMDVANKTIDSFIVTEIEHYVDQIDHYHNNFRAIYSDLNAIPMTPIEAPRTGVQQATVMDNADSKGRVKVQLQWQKNLGKSTNWVRVQTPDAGSSDKVSSNRGFVCIPEIGDTVVVGFEYGDPNKPFVMGSLFSETTGIGGGDGNKNKSITTRSGSALKLDDDSGSVLLADPGKSSMNMDGAGNVVINSTESITLVCGSSTVVLNKNGEITVNGKKIGVNGEDRIVNQSGSELLVVQKGEGVSASGKKISLSGKTEANLVSKATVNVAGKTANMNGDTTNINGSATVVVDGGIVKINS